jgi:hypothetical protein
MRRSTSWWLRLGLCGLAVFGTGPAGRAQTADPPPLPGPALVNPDELGRLAGQLGQQLRRLGEVVDAEMGGSDRGRQVRQEATELAQAADEFRGAARTQADRFQLVQSYAGIDATWHNLAAMLGRPGASTPAVGRAAGQVAETDAQIHQTLGVNPAPSGYYGATPPEGAAEVQRLARALVDRAEALAAVVRTEMAGNGRAIQDAINLAALSDTFHDSLKLEGRVDATIANGYTGVAGQADRLGGQFLETPPPPRVLGAWRAFRSVDVLLRRDLGLHTRPPDLEGTLLAPAPGGPSPVVALADQLYQQVTDFLRVFGPTASTVPEGGLLLADAESLQAAVAGLRRLAAAPQPRTTTAQLAYEFRSIDALWQRLARRTNRIARGRTGPKIRQIALMGQTVAQIHQLLGLPGYPPVIAAP